MDISNIYARYIKYFFPVFCSSLCYTELMSIDHFIRVSDLLKEEKVHRETPFQKKLINMMIKAKAWMNCNEVVVYMWKRELCMVKLKNYKLHSYIALGSIVIWTKMSEMNLREGWRLEDAELKIEGIIHNIRTRH